MKKMALIKSFVFTVLVFVIFAGCTMFVPFLKKGFVVMNCENGRLDFDVSRTDGVDVITVKAFPDENYYCEKIYIFNKDGIESEESVKNLTKISDEEISFTLGTADIYVSAIFLKKESSIPTWKVHRIIDDNTLCALNIMEEAYPADEIVRFTTYCRSRYMRIVEGYPKAWLEDGTEFELEQNKTDKQEYFFKMPAQEVYVESKIEWVNYPITVLSLSDGSIDVPAEAHETEKVVFKTVPEAGKTVDVNSVVVFDDAVPPNIFSVIRSTTNANEFTFQMPGRKVNIYAAFK